ncbi:ABC transporter permease [Cryobacterium sp. TMT1-21]|uniref:ABC transporter permease n=1 Tax=Cryobacterium shii TaxID=1259235 RepID=A0AAQ2C7I6_9MICO|nr:ABC transporter permease [Cryobacterium shii]TFC81615.1 ABC transporter permease [Cryobacterium sp. TmT2-59]TFD11709.1 ABC transporter permease [Cryobacterium sp. TMT1-21]TFD18899.1 ABC transporter permease [Cryobacterium sp. TMT4-10]TFD25714.1 ABC transporter permease [Cryobacterium sp. TMT2-23]TFD40290.1 ABC transporter permease [Cryobacterium sp. TMT2-10]
MPAQLAALLPSLAGVLLLILIVTLVLWTYRVSHPFAPALAVLRGALQLAAISLVLSGIISDPLWVGVGLVVMFTAAVGTVTRRIGASRQHFAWVAAAMGLGVLASLLVVFGTGALESTPRYVLSFGGIIIGNAMSIATLSGRRFGEAVTERWDEVEGWLALGATPRQATRELARRAVYFALIPSTDQTKTTGLVTLPGAFVGAIFGGASPLEAGRFQIIVLAGILCAGSIAAVALIHLLAPVRQRPLTAPV